MVKKWEKLALAPFKGAGIGTRMRRKREDKATMSSIKRRKAKEARAENSRPCRYLTRSKSQKLKVIPEEAAPRTVLGKLERARRNQQRLKFETLHKRMITGNIKTKLYDVMSKVKDRKEKDDLVISCKKDSGIGSELSFSLSSTDDFSLNIVTSPNHTEDMNEEFRLKGFWRKGDFYDKKLIGVGGFSKVFKACVKGYSQELALKQLTAERTSTSCLTEQDVRVFHEEYMLHRGLQHENILRVFGYFTKKRTAVIVMEYCMLGDLQEYLYKTNESVSIERSRNYIRQLCKALEYLHLTMKILHMDLKLENILVQNDGRLKLTDFGFAKRFNNLRDVHTDSRGGTRWYKPPEQLHTDGCYDSTFDIWGMGVVAFELVMDYHPFFSTENTKGENGLQYCSEAEVPAAKSRMVDGSVGIFRRQEVFDRQPDDFKQFIQMTLSYARVRRPTANELHSLPWIRYTEP